MPFAKAAALLACFTHTRVSESSAQRHTEAIGIAYEAVQLAEVEHIERDWPDVGAGPQKLLLGADGAMVPLLPGEWAEVKTLVVGQLGEPVERDGERVVPTHSLSYFWRLTDAETFQKLTLAELQRRCLETAGQVAAVSDGAEWIQGFVDYDCREALRILDFPHAAQRVCQIGEAVLGAAAASLAAWQQRQLHTLKHSGPEQVVAALRRFAAEHLTDQVVSENLAYLDKRLTQMQYPTFQAQGWPIGMRCWRCAMPCVTTAGRRPGERVVRRYDRQVWCAGQCNPSGWQRRKWSRRRQCQRPLSNQQVRKRRHPSRRRIIRGGERIMRPRHVWQKRRLKQNSDGHPLQRAHLTRGVQLRRAIPQHPSRYLSKRHTALHILSKDQERNLLCDT